AAETEVVRRNVLEWAAANARGGVPVANLGYDAPVAWRSAHANEHALYARMAPGPIDTIALLMSNAPEGAVVSIYAANTLNQLATGNALFGLPAAVPFRASPNLPGRPGYH